MHQSLPPSNGFIEQKLCLTCGLCCNGVIFADVQLQAGDDPRRLSALGLVLNTTIGKRTQTFAQPCVSLDGCRCRIYAERPQYCRQFECLLLKEVKAGRITTPTALRIITTARERAALVRSLLGDLGDTEETLSLAARFRKTSRRMEKCGLDKATAEIYGNLTLAMQDLNYLLQEAFYSHGSAIGPQGFDGTS